MSCSSKRSSFVEFNDASQHGRSPEGQLFTKLSIPANSSTVTNSTSKRPLLKVCLCPNPLLSLSLNDLLGVDIICAQGGEGGGHTGSTPFSILIPAAVDACRGVISPLMGKPVFVVAAGGIADGRGLAASLSCATLPFSHSYLFR